MTAIHIRDVPPRTLDALKRLARSHHRSLQGELHAILEMAARVAPPDGGTPPMNLVTVKTGLTTTWSRDEIYGSGDR